MVEQRVQVHRIPAYDKSHEKRRRQIPEQVQHVEPVMVRVQAGDRAAHRVDAVGKGQPWVQFAEEVMKMDPPPGGERQAGEKVVEDKAFPSPGTSPDVYPLRAACRGHQLLTEGVKAGDE